MFEFLGSPFMATFLWCSSMATIFMVYICLLCFPQPNEDSNLDVVSQVNPKQGKGGLSSSQLEKLPKVTGKELVLGTDCAVCLDEIESHQLVRMIPGCNHGFHVQCGDSWLARNSVCPVCRAKISDEFFIEASQC